MGLEAQGYQSRHSTEMACILELCEICKNKRHINRIDQIIQTIMKHRESLNIRRRYKTTCQMSSASEAHALPGSPKTFKYSKNNSLSHTK